MITIDPKSSAIHAAGNWQKFESFAWFDKPDDAENWTLVYTSNRDSGLLAQSNAAAIDKAMKPFMKPFTEADEGDEADVIPQRHSHWVCGHIDGYAIRVFRNGQVTPAFTKWCKLQERLDDYPVLDEEDYSEREHEATVENVRFAGDCLARCEGWNLPDGWEYEVVSWLWDNDQSAVENSDDQGGYASDDQLRAAFQALGFSI